MSVITIRSPIRVTFNGKERPLNLNNYRNNHHHTNAGMKLAYQHVIAEDILDAFEGVSLNRITLVEYVINPGTSRSFDISNIACIVDKFFMDVLVKLEVIPDDSCHFVPKVSYLIGDTCRGDEHCSINIYF